MKQASLILNIVLLVAVAILYFLHFRQGAGTEVAPAAPPVAVSVKPSTIVFFNNDSLNDQYSFLKAKRAELESRHEKVAKELEAEAGRIRSDYENYQRQQSTMTTEQRMQTEESLMRRQQQLGQNEKQHLAAN